MAEALQGDDGRFFSHCYIRLVASAHTHVSAVQRSRAEWIGLEWSGVDRVFPFLFLSCSLVLMLSSLLLLWVQYRLLHPLCCLLQSIPGTPTLRSRQYCKKEHQDVCETQNTIFGALEQHPVTKVATELFQGNGSRFSQLGTCRQSSSSAWAPRSYQ